jgi:hypothetical protein
MNPAAALHMPAKTNCQLFGTCDHTLYILPCAVFPINQQFASIWHTLMTKSGSLSPSFKYTLMAGAAGQQATANTAAAAATAGWYKIWQLQR